MVKSVMWDYMYEEKGLLSSLLRNSNVKSTISQLNEIGALYIVAHGSSYNAAHAAAPFIMRQAGIRVYVYTPSAFRYNALALPLENLSNTLVLGISQTGTSRGVLEALDYANDLGFKLIGITNEKDSPITQKSHLTFYLECGEEDSNAKTKGYSATILTLLIFGLEIAALRGRITPAEKAAQYSELQKQIDEIDSVIENTVAWCTKNDYGKNIDNIYMVGNGMNFATAMEGQLKIMETYCIPTMFNDIEEFSHGMHRSLNQKSHVVLLNAKVDCDLMDKTLAYLKSKAIDVLMVNAQSPKKDDAVINISSYADTSSIFLMTAAIQAVSVCIPEANGLDPNRPANNDYTDCVETRV